MEERGGDRSGGASIAPDTAFRHVRIIAAGLALSPTAVAVVAWVVTNGGAVPVASSAAGLADTLFLAWLVLTAGAVAAAVVMWRKKVEPVAWRARESRERPADVRAARLVTGLILVWALIEGPAMLGVVLFLLQGLQNVLVTSLAVLWVGMVITRPRAEWFETTRVPPAGDTTGGVSRMGGK